MRAIILAAGIGSRLGEISGGKPKCLLEFGGVTLLQRHIALLEQLGICDLLIVTGYRENEVIAELDGQNHEIRITSIFNPDYDSGSVISLWTARTFLESGDDIILMDADVLYHPDILRTLVNTQHQNCFLLDREFEAGDEPVKICVQDNLMVEFRKQIDTGLEFDFQGESVGFFRFNAEVAGNLARQCRHYMDTQQPDTPYEEAIRDLLLQNTDMFNYEDISGLPWIEIDFPEDVGRAENEILTRISE